MKKAIALVAISLMGTAAYARHKTTVRVEVAKVEDRMLQSRSAGLPGLIAGNKTEDIVFAIKVTIEGEKVQLTCAEGHHNCPALSPGESYEGELSKSDVWVTSQQPLTHKMQRTHYRINGSW